MPDLKLLLEAEKRGILPPDKRALLDEAKRRGLVGGGESQQPRQAYAGDMERSVQSGVKEGASVLGRAVSNLPGSAWQLAKDVTAPIHSPVQTAKGMGNLAMGAVQKLIPGEQGSEQHADAFGRYLSDRYGGLDALKKTLAEDPAGFAADIGGLLTGGGGIAVKAAGTAGKVARVGAMAQKVAQAPSRAAKATGRGIAKATPELLGIATGQHSAPIKLAYKATREGGERADILKGHMEKTLPMDAPVKEAREVFSSMHEKTGKAYTQGVDKLLNAKVKDKRVGDLPMNLGKIRGELEEIAKLGTVEGVSVNSKAGRVRKRIHDQMEAMTSPRWIDRALDPSTYAGRPAHVKTKMIAQAKQAKVMAGRATSKQGLTSASVDSVQGLKRALGEILEDTEHGTQAWKIANDAYHSVNDALEKKVPGYKKVNAEYAARKEALSDIGSSMSLGKGALTETTLKKMQAALRDNVYTSYGMKEGYLKNLMDAGAENLDVAVAGQSLSSYAPRGLSRLLPGVAGGYGLGTGAIAPMLPLMAATSPRLVGKGAIGAAKLAEALAKMKPIPAGTGYGSFQAGRTARVSQ